MSKSKKTTVKNNAKKTDNKEALKALKLSHKAQLEALKDAKKEEQAQFGMFNRLKQMDRDFDSFNLNPFQSAIVNNIGAYFMPLTTCYTKHMKRKAEQVERLKNGKEPLINHSYVLTYENNGTEFKKTFKSEKDALKVKKSLTVKNVTIEHKESEVKTGFSENEAIRLLHKAEKKFFEAFPSAEAVTVPMLKTALSMDITDKEKKEVKKFKVELKKAS